MSKKDLKMGTVLVGSNYKYKWEVVGFGPCQYTCSIKNMEPKEALQGEVILKKLSGTNSVFENGELTACNMDTLLLFFREMPK